MLSETIFSNKEGYSRKVLRDIPNLLNLLCEYENMEVLINIDTSSNTYTQEYIQTASLNGSKQIKLILSIK